MARRRLKHIRVGQCSVSVYRDSAWDELLVVTKTPLRRWNGTYHTDDMPDARATAASQIRQLRRARVC